MELSRIWSNVSLSGAMEGVPWRVLLSSHALSLGAYRRGGSWRSMPTIDANWLTQLHVWIWSILLQKSQKAPWPIFRLSAKRAKMADQCSLKRVAGIACELARGGGAP